MATNKKQQLTDQMKEYIRTTVYNELIRKGCTLDMAKHLIENFIAGKPGSKEELIDAWELDTIRICEYCGMPMFEGYLVNDSETYCSEKCEEVMLITYTDGHTDECPYLRKGRDY